MEPRTPSKSKPQINRFSQNPRIVKITLTVLIILVLVLVCGFLITRISIVHFVWKRGSYYTVVLDCGSTGTRVNVYEWRADGSGSDDELPFLLRSYPENFGKIDGCQYHCMQTEPGLDKFVGNASGVRVSVEPLIGLAEQWVPLEKRGVTPIFVLATAGMRGLSSEDARQVLENVEDVVKEHGFLFRKGWIRVLSGKEEAYYGWIALNYKMGKFGNSSRSPTLGLLDLGGSSLQVVTEVNELGQDEHAFVSKVGSFEHRVLAYSLPAFGFNEAFDRTVTMLSYSHALRESGDGIFKIAHPCLSSGFVRNYSCHGCFGLSSDSSRNITSMEENKLDYILLFGDSNWEECKVIARAAAVNSSKPELSQLNDHSKCIGFSVHGGSRRLNLTQRAHSIRQYHALSGFFAVYKKLNLSSGANLTKMLEIGEPLCRSSGADHTSTSGQDCFRLPYMLSLVEDALCLRNLELSFGPGDVSWTLGAALLEADYLWLSTTKSQSGLWRLKSTVIMSSPVLLFALLLCLLFIVYRSQIKLPMLGRRTSPGRTSLPSYLCPKRQTGYVLLSVAMV